jgi:hypothetical protein
MFIVAVMIEELGAPAAMSKRWAILTHPPSEKSRGSGRCADVLRRRGERGATKLAG